MEEPAKEPEGSDTKAKLSEATGQAILVTALAWAVFILIQARWYMPTFNVQPYSAKWLAVTFVTGAAPTLLVLLFAFLLSWVIGAIRPVAFLSRRPRRGLRLHGPDEFGNMVRPGPIGSVTPARIRMAPF